MTRAVCLRRRREQGKASRLTATGAHDPGYPVRASTGIQARQPRQGHDGAGRLTMVQSWLASFAFLWRSRSFLDVSGAVRALSDSRAVGGPRPRGLARDRRAEMAGAA